MPAPSTSNKNALELAAANLRKATMIGTFTVLLEQTQNHPDQQALDQSWVDTLVERIGTPEILNRALHPISVILENDAYNQTLEALLEEQGVNSAPKLPQELSVLVFAGQHRLAMLSQLDLGGQENMWWHAHVYKQELERDHPAKFLTMMHESNSPQLMKRCSDLELFCAVRKLKKLLKSGTINEQTFLQNRCMLLGGLDDRTNRAICNLTRNDELMDAISDSLSRVHIAGAFSAGSWMRLTTGCLYMVASGLVQEMLAQVDLLTKGMSDVPKDAMNLPPRSCQLSKIQATKAGKRKLAHAWDALPGGQKQALQRASTRPTSFVSHLNPRKEDPWTFPDMVLLPSCLGSKIIEEELRLTQVVITHIVNMITTEEQFSQHTKSSETMESPVDHPAGVIAHFLMEKHGNEANAQGYEYKIIQRVWLNRAILYKDLQNHKVLAIEDAAQDKYQKLIDKSQAWWTAMRLFKVKHLRTKFDLLVPKVFGGNCEQSMVDDVAQQSRSSQRPKHPVDASFDNHPLKRQRLSTNRSPSTDGPAIATEETQESSATANDHEAMDIDSPHDGRTGSTNGEDEEGSEQTNGGVGAQGGNKGEGEGEGKDGREDVNEGDHLDDKDNDDDDDNNNNNNIAPVELRRGGDRRLGQALAQITSTAEVMTREESRAMTELLGQIVASHRDGDMVHLVNALVAKGKHVLLKQRKQQEHNFESPDEDEERDAQDEASSPLGNSDVEGAGEVEDYGPQGEEELE
ncbi:hypothetical protein RhiXN_11248 [Rhizoctonia solani]|uniref:Uncharacterized protein n=2 Tax=Rhizoctonia solani TaxID=456999 RepID=A0A8H8T179_9AGAM|nr:uncharacterized protein RhiXN_11248 [Rhizoctonia solani]QRW26171.1 hypothetical protein RhiXN_11248 [Rhizoctonia solani]